MTPNPRHGTPEGDATIAIRAFARKTNVDTQALLTFYMLEGLLRRVALSKYRNDFVLKGGVLMAAFAARRSTRDVDLQVTRLSDEIEAVSERIREVIGQKLRNILLRTIHDLGELFLGPVARF